MKTAIVYTNQEECKLLICDGDQTEYDQVWVGTGHPKEGGLAKILYDEEGNFLLKKVTNKEFEDEIKAGAPIICCGWLL